MAMTALIRNGTPGMATMSNRMYGVSDIPDGLWWRVKAARVRSAWIIQPNNLSYRPFSLPYYMTLLYSS